MRAVWMMSLDDRVAHVPGPEHGVALCGSAMRDPWQVGAADVLLERAVSICSACWNQAA